MTTPDPTITAPRPTRVVLVGGAVSGIGAYAFTILGARVLGEVDYAPVGVLWTIQYLVLTVGLLSLEALVTRERHVPAAARRWIGLLVAGMAALGWVFGERLFGSSSPGWPLASGLVALGFGVFVLARGLAASRGHFGGYAWMTGGESALRLVAAIIVLIAAPGPVGLALILPSGALGVAALWTWLSRDRAAAPAEQVPVVSTPAGTGRFLAATTLANAVLQVLLAGGPLLTAAVGASAAVTSQVFVTTTAARAPLVLLYSGVLTRLLTDVPGWTPDELRHRLRTGVAGAVALAGVAGAIGAVAGPPLVALAFGPEFRPSTAFAALTAIAVALAIGVLAANQVLISLRATDRLVAPWLAGLIVGLAVALLTSGPADLRAGSATVAGLGVAALGMALRMREAGRRAAIEAV